MFMAEMMAGLLENIIPAPDADKRSLYVHRLRVTLVACASFTGLIFSVLFALGSFPHVFPGFARADTVRSLTNQSHAVWELQLDSSIISLRRKQCASKSDAARTLYWQRISSDIEEWQELTHRDRYPLPECTDL